jgi:uncharacterized membrane protein
MIEQETAQDVTSAAADSPPAAEVVADETAPEDMPTEVVPQSSLTPPKPEPAAPPQRNIPPRPSGQPRPAGIGIPRVPPTPAAAGERRRDIPSAGPLIGAQPQQPMMPSAVAYTHAPMHASSSWGATTFVITAEAAAGFSYLFWWVSGMLVYFNERENRFVRFHAVQSILLTGVLSIFSVFAFTVAAIFNDQFLSTHQHVWQDLSGGTAVLSAFIVVFLWLVSMVAAWSGTYLQLPIIGDYAERFAAPPIQLRP